ncbi:MAG: hypothetical protein AB7O73_12990 [Bacteroidia bacterium]
MSFTDFFLKSKHWHLFMLFFGLPLVFAIVFTFYTISTIIRSGTEPDPLFMFSYMEWLFAVVLIFTGLFYGWIWSIAIGLQKMIPEELQLKTNLFKVFFFVPIVFSILVMVWVWSIIHNIQETIEYGEGFNPANFIITIILMIPFNLFSLFCTFYCFYFAARTLKTLELQRETNVSDYILEIIMFWFYPVGVWLIQPKVNRLS